MSDSLERKGVMEYKRVTIYRRNSIDLFLMSVFLYPINF